METIKRNLPLQSSSSEFDNFFGLKFGTTMGEICFKMLYSGFDIENVYRKKKIISIAFVPSNVFMLDIEVNEVVLSFEYYKDFLRLVRSSVSILKDKVKENEIIENSCAKLLSNYSIKEKRQFFIEKYTKRYLTFDESEKVISIIFSEKKAPAFDFDIFFSFAYWFTIYSREGCKYESQGEKFTNLFKNANFDLRSDKISYEQKCMQNALIVGIFMTLDWIEVKEFIDCWQNKKYSKYLPELAEKVYTLFKSSQENVDPKKIKDNIKKTIFELQKEIGKEIDKEKEIKKQEKAAKKQEEKANKNAEIQKLNDELADF